MNKRPSFSQLLVAVFFLRVPFLRLRYCLRRIEKYGLDLPYQTLIAHHLAGGRMRSLVDGLVYAQEHDIKITMINGAARDLMGASGSGITLTEHIQILERAGCTDIHSAPFDSLRKKSAR